MKKRRITPRRKDGSPAHHQLARCIRRSWSVFRSEVRKLARLASRLPAHLRREHRRMGDALAAGRVDEVAEILKSKISTLLEQQGGAE